MKLIVCILFLLLLLKYSKGQICNITYPYSSLSYPTSITVPSCMGSNLANIYRYDLFYTTINNVCVTPPWPPTCQITQFTGYTLSPQTTNLCMTSNSSPTSGVASSGCSSINIYTVINTDNSTCSGSPYCGVDSPACGTSASSTVYWIGNSCDLCPCAATLPSNCSFSFDSFLYCNAFVYETISNANTTGGAIFSIIVNGTTRAIKIQSFQAAFTAPTTGTLTASIWYQIGNTLNTTGGAAAWTLLTTQVVTIFFTLYQPFYSFPDFTILSNQNVFFFIGAVSTNGQFSLVHVRNGGAAQYIQSDYIIVQTAIGTTPSKDPLTSFTLNPVLAGAFPQRAIGYLRYCLY
jgi:hypothetical protein